MTIFDQNVVDYESVSLRFFKNLLKKGLFWTDWELSLLLWICFLCWGIFFERFCKFRGFLSSWGSWGYFRFLRDISPILRIRFHFEEILWGSWEISWRNFKRCFEILEDSSRLIKFLEVFFLFYETSFFMVFKNGNTSVWWDFWDFSLLGGFRISFKKFFRNSLKCV